MHCKNIFWVGLWCVLGLASLVWAADEPSQVQLKITPGESHNLKIHQVTKIAQNIEGYNVNWVQTVDLQYTFRVKDIADDGTVTIIAECGSVAAEIKNPFETVRFDSAKSSDTDLPLLQRFARLKKGFVFTLGPKGELGFPVETKLNDSKNKKITKEDFGALMREIFAILKDDNWKPSLSALFIDTLRIPAGKETAGIWPAKLTIPSGDLSLRADLQCQLLSQNNGLVGVKIAGPVQYSDEVAQTVEVDKTEKSPAQLKLAGTLSGQLEYNGNTLKVANITSNLSGEAIQKSGNTTPFSLVIEMVVESF